VCVMTEVIWRNTESCGVVMWRVKWSHNVAHSAERFLDDDVVVDRTCV